MLFNLYYKCKDGAYVSENDVERAYTLVTGKHRYESETDYFKWVDSIWGKYIVSACKEDDLVIDKNLIERSKILAVRLYRERNGCGLKEAKDAIDAMEKD